MSLGLLRQQYLTPSSPRIHRIPLLRYPLSLIHHLAFHTHHYDLPNLPSIRITSSRHLRHDLFLFIIPLPYAPISTSHHVHDSLFALALDSIVVSIQQKMSHRFHSRDCRLIVYCVPLYLHHLHQPTASCLSRKLFSPCSICYRVSGHLGWLELLVVSR